MDSYEVVHEILNSCPNNQMRDITFLEVETENPVQWVERFLKNRAQELEAETLSDGSVRIHALCDGLRHRFVFTKD